MNETQLELTRLIGKKELTFGCWLFIQNPDGYAQYIEETDAGNGFTIMSATDGYSVLNDKRDIIKDWNIIGHPATLSDLHRWMNERGWIWEQRDCDIKIFDDINLLLSYNSSFDLLDQSPETLTQLISIIKYLGTKKIFA